MLDYLAVEIVHKKYLIYPPRLVKKKNMVTRLDFGFGNGNMIFFQWKIVRVKNCVGENFNLPTSVYFVILDLQDTKYPDLFTINT